MEKAAFTIYLIVLVLSPLLFGAVHTYAYTIMSLGVLTASLLLLKKNIRKNHKSGVYEFKVPATSLNFLFIILLIFLIFQIIPLPDTILDILSPESSIVGQKSLPASSVLAPESKIREWFAISPYYYPVRMSIIRWTVYGLLFLGLTQVLNSRRRIELAILVILSTGCFEALYGLIQTYSGSGHIWWLKKTSYRGDVSGTYINRNHFAGLMVMIMMLAAAYTAGFKDKKKRKQIIPASDSSLRTRIIKFLSGEPGFSKRSLIFFAGVVMGIGLVFSASRGGLISAAGAMLCMSLLFLFKKGHRLKGIVVLSLFLIISVYALHIGAEYTASRFKSLDISYKMRKRLAQKTLEMFNDYRIMGVGVGNFQYAYPRYQASEDTRWFIRHAHNDWAQFLAETGITGLVLLLAGISYYVYRTFKLWRKRSDPFAICVGIAPLTVMTAIGIHSYFDFNLHIPANFLMLVAITAIGYSALHIERRHGREKTLIRDHAFPLKYKGALFLIMIMGLIIWNGFWTIRHFVAECYCNTVTQYQTLNRDQDPPLEEVKKAIQWDGENATYWWKLAWKLIRIRDEEIANPEWNIEKHYNRQMEIILALERAVRLNPLRVEHHLQLGWEYTGLRQKPDYHKKWLPAADRSMERVAYFTGEKHRFLYEGMGNYWVMRSKTIPPANPEWHTAWTKACWHYKKAMSLSRGRVLKKMIKRIRGHIWIYYPDEVFVKQAIK